MFDVLRNRALRWLKVPPEPHPPAGNPASLRVFRAGRNYYRLRLVGWGITQVLAFAGIVFWTGMLLEVEHVANAQRPAAVPTSQGDSRVDTASGDQVIVPTKRRTRNQRLEQWRQHFEQDIKAVTKANEHESLFKRNWAAFKQVCVEFALVMPRWIFPIAWVLKIIGIVVYLVQLFVSYAATRLDYEMRWYLVTDRSLRLRHGVWTVWESTMSFANIQQVVVSQDPLQRLLGLANVKVQSAGGGTGQREQHRDDMHVGYFHSVTNAEEIRDLILERLRRFRESGLGDPDEKPSAAAPALEKSSDQNSDLLTAARELAAEARRLRQTLEA